MDQPELPYQVKIENFEGPLDLLLHLIKKNEINIYDIPIALIAQQYLDYLSVMKELNLAVAGEFLVMAATLLHNKSRMVVPVDEGAVDEGGPNELPARGPWRPPPPGSSGVRRPPGRPAGPGWRGRSRPAGSRRSGC